MSLSDSELLERVLRQIIKMFVRGNLCYYNHMSTMVHEDLTSLLPV